MLFVSGVPLRTVPNAAAARSATPLRVTFEMTMRVPMQDLVAKINNDDLFHDQRCDSVPYEQVCQLETLEGEVDGLIAKLPRNEQVQLSQTLYYAIRRMVRTGPNDEELPQAEQRERLFREAWMTLYASVVGIAPLVLALQMRFDSPVTTSPQPQLALVHESAGFSTALAQRMEETVVWTSRYSTTYAMYYAFCTGFQWAQQLMELFRSSGKRGLLLGSATIDQMIAYEDGRVHFNDFDAQFNTVVYANASCVEFINITIFLSHCFCRLRREGPGAASFLAGLTYELRNNHFSSVYQGVVDAIRSLDDAGADDFSYESLCYILFQTDRFDTEDRAWFDDDTSANFELVAKKIMGIIADGFEESDFCVPTENDLELEGTTTQFPYLVRLVIRSMRYFQQFDQERRNMDENWSCSDAEKADVALYGLRNDRMK